MANPAKLIWDDMEFDNWIGFVTGDVNGDGQSDGSGLYIKIRRVKKKPQALFLW